MRRGTIVSVAVAISASISCPQPSRLQTRTRTVSPLSSLTFTPTRVGCLQVGQTIITFETSSGDGRSMIPPGMMLAPPMRVESRIGRGFVWRFSEVEVLDDDPSVARARLEDASLLAAVLAGEHLDEVALLDPHGGCHF